MTGEQRGCHAERGDLREREVHEDHATREDVQAEIGVNPREHQTREEGESQDLEREAHGASAPASLRTLTSNSVT